MSDAIVYLGLGSNLGDREANLRHALELLATRIHLETVSSLYDTEPWGYKEQPTFLNCTCEGRTSLQPRALLEAVKEVELTIGKVPTFRNGPRIIDVDILFYGQHLVSEPGLKIPHPRLTERAFVLVPLNEIAPQYVHPVLNLTVANLLTKVAAEGRGFPEGVKLSGPPICLKTN